MPGDRSLGIGTRAVVVRRAFTGPRVQLELRVTSARSMIAEVEPPALDEGETVRFHPRTLHLFDESGTATSHVDLA